MRDFSIYVDMMMIMMMIMMTMIFVKATLHFTGQDLMAKQRKCEESIKELRKDLFQYFEVTLLMTCIFRGLFNKWFISVIIL